MEDGARPSAKVLWRWQETGKGNEEMAPVQFFLNESDSDLRDCANKIEAVGHEVRFAPTSGPSAVWFGDFEITGSTAIQEFIARLSEQPVTTK